MPGEVIYEDMRLPASYANFYICNNYVIVPTFRDKMMIKLYRYFRNVSPEEM